MEGAGRWGGVNERAGTAYYVLTGEGNDMSFFCAPRRQGPNVARTVGVAMMAAGLLMLLIFVPRWVWTGALAIVLISVGFLLWRFS